MTCGGTVIQRAVVSYDIVPISILYQYNIIELLQSSYTICGITSCSVLFPATGSLPHLLSYILFGVFEEENNNVEGTW
jgi:hypothetical protein